MSPELIQLPDSARRLAFGCYWRTVIDSDDYLAVAQRQAREAGASLLWADPDEPIFGMAQVTSRRAPRKTGSIHAAAIAFGKHAGLADAIALLRLPDDMAWFCVTRKRMPVSGHDVVCTPREALERAAQYLQQNPGFAPTVYGDVDNDAFRMQPLSLSVLDSECGEVTAMTRVGTTTLKLKYLAAGLIAVALVAYVQYQQWSSEQSRQRRIQEQAAKEAEQASKHQQAYRRQLNDWLSSHKLADSRAVQPLRESLGEMPSNIAGWYLTDVSCVSAPASAKAPSLIAANSQTAPGDRTASVTGGAWSCIANYKRTASIKATNQAFDRARPAHWRVRWQPMDRLEAAFEVATELREPRLDEFPPTSRVLTETVTAIQEISPALTSVQISAFATPQDFPMPAPGTKPAQTAVSTPRVMTANISVTGPLRSFDLLNGKDLPAHWQSVSVSIQKGRPADIRTSAVMATFKGIIYATSAD